MYTKTKTAIGLPPSRCAGYLEGKCKTVAKQIQDEPKPQHRCTTISKYYDSLKQVCDYQETRLCQDYLY